MRACAILMLGLLPGAAAAETERTIEEALGRLRPGQAVRLVLLDRETLEGIYTGREGGGIQLDPGERSVPAAGVNSLWVRGRSTRRGALVGAVLAGSGGLAFGALFAAFCAGESDEGCPEVVPILGFGGLAAGAAAGAIVGAALPRWHRILGKDAWAGSAVPGPPSEPGRRGIGSLGLALGLSRSTEAGTPAGGAAAALRLFALGVERLAFGPEIGVYQLGRKDYVSNGQAYSLDERADHAGGIVRWSPLQGRFRPYAIGGAGYYHWQGLDLINDEAFESTADFFGVNLGGGAQGRLGGDRWSWSLEARWHANVQNLVANRDYRFIAFLAGAACRW